MLQYEISGKTAKVVNAGLIKKCVKAFDSLAKIKTAKSFSLVFIDSQTIRKLNRAYRGQDRVTDVLSFAQSDSDFVGPGEEKELGEILICLPVAKSQARQYGWKLDYEICRLLVHGLAHLIGYEHEGVGKREEAQMVRFEQKVMCKLF